MTLEQDEYIKEAMKELEKLSSDPKKRAEYDAREKAIKDYVTQMMEAEERGREEGREEERACLLQLTTAMVKDNLADEIERLATDESFLKEMLQKYKL